jgi:L-lactate dehydrogenase
MKPIRQDAIILVVSNPVDLLMSLVVELSGLSESQVIGSGKFLDSVRLRRLLADRMGVSTTNFARTM